MADQNQYGYFRDVQLDEFGYQYVNTVGNTTPLISTDNTSDVVLASGATFTGTAELNAYPDVMLTIKTDQPGTLYLDLSVDGTNWDSSLNWNYHVEEINPPHIIVKGPRYVRVRFVNTSTSAQTYMRLNAFYGSFNKLTSPIDGRLSQNFDAIATRPSEYNYETALGNREGASTWNKWGYNEDIDIGTETIWSVGGEFVPLTAADTLSIVSTSSDDTSGGIGSRSIIIYGIDENRKEQVQVVTLTGLVPVVTTTQWLGINRLAISESGSSQVNIGRIRATAVTAGTIQNEIPIGAGSSQTAVFFTQSDHQALFDWMLINAAKIAGGGSPVVTIKVWVLSFISNSKYEVYRGVIDSSVENHVELTPPQPFVVGPSSIMYVNITTDTNNTVGSVRFSGIEVKNR